VPCYFLAPCDKCKHTAHAHQQAASQASTDSTCRHTVWLLHSSLGFQRPAGRCRPQAAVATDWCHKPQSRKARLWLAIIIIICIAPCCQRYTGICGGTGELRGLGDRQVFNTDTHLSASFSRNMWIRRHQKRWTNLDFNEARDNGVAVTSTGPHENHLHLALDR